MITLNSTYNQVKRFLSACTLSLCLMFQHELAANRNFQFMRALTAKEIAIFIISLGKEDDVFSMVVNYARVLNTSVIDFRISGIGNKGEEVVTRSACKEIGVGWIFAWKPKLLVSPGKYSVSIFDANGFQFG